MQLFHEHSILWSRALKHPNVLQYIKGKQLPVCQSTAILSLFLLLYASYFFLLLILCIVLPSSQDLLQQALEDMLWEDEEKELEKREKKRLQKKRWLQLRKKFIALATVGNLKNTNEDSDSDSEAMREEEDSDDDNNNSNNNNNNSSHVNSSSNNSNINSRTGSSSSSNLGVAQPVGCVVPPTAPWLHSDSPPPFLPSRLSSHITATYLARPTINDEEVFKGSKYLYAEEGLRQLVMAEGSHFPNLVDSHDKRAELIRKYLQKDPHEVPPYIIQKLVTTAIELAEAQASANIQINHFDIDQKVSQLPGLKKRDLLTYIIANRADLADDVADLLIAKDYNYVVHAYKRVVEEGVMDKQRQEQQTKKKQPNKKRKMPATTTATESKKHMKMLK